MLEHFHAGNDVVRARVRFGQRLGRHLPVFQFCAAFHGVRPGHLERGLAHVDARDAGARQGHGLTQYSAPASHIHDTQAMKRRARIDESQAQGIDQVQRLELAFGVPPPAGKFLELVDLRRIHVFVRDPVCLDSCTHDPEDGGCRAIFKPHWLASARTRSSSSRVNVPLSRTWHPPIQTWLTWSPAQP